MVFIFVQQRSQDKGIVNRYPDLIIYYCETGTQREKRQRKWNKAIVVALVMLHQQRVLMALIPPSNKYAALFSFVLISVSIYPSVKTEEQETNTDTFSKTSESNHLTTRKPRLVYIVYAPFPPSASSSSVQPRTVRSAQARRLKCLALLATLATTIVSQENCSL